MQRSTRRLTLTDEGRRFLADARAALRLLDDAVADVTQSAQAARGRVRISVGIAFGRRWVLPALPAISAAHPELQVDVDLDNRPVDLVAEGYDIGIRGGVIDDSSLVARRIAALPLVMVATPGYLRAAGVPATPADLAQHRCAVARFAPQSTPAWNFRQPNGRRIAIEPAASIVVNDAEALVDVALAGGGIVQTALTHALPYLRTGRLKLLLTDQHDPGTRESVLHYPHRRYLAPRVRVTVDALLAHFAACEDLHLTPGEALKRFPGWRAGA